jgi:hypothetical protein
LKLELTVDLVVLARAVEKCACMGRLSLSHAFET